MFTPEHIASQTLHMTNKTVLKNSYEKHELNILNSYWKAWHFYIEKLLGTIIKNFHLSPWLRLGGVYKTSIQGQCITQFFLNPAIRLGTKVILLKLYMHNNSRYYFCLPISPYKQFGTYGLHKEGISKVFFNQTNASIDCDEYTLYPTLSQQIRINL